MLPVLPGLAVMCWGVLSAAGERGESAFAQAAQGPLGGIAGAGVYVGVLVPGWLFDRDVNADAGAVIAGVGEGGQPDGGGPVRRGCGRGCGLR
jgi:hypothetical protein